MNEKNLREATEESMLRMMEDVSIVFNFQRFGRIKFRTVRFSFIFNHLVEVVAKMQNEMANERREREATEETLLKLLEDTCTKLNSATEGL